MSQQLLDEALEARRREDAPECLRLLELAAHQAQDPRTRATACWRLAKAHLDFDQPQHMLDALQPIWEAPFAHYPRSMAAMERLAPAWADAVGYADPRLVELWRAWEEAVSDPQWRARGQVARAWVHACRGEVQEVATLVSHYESLRPADLQRKAPELKPHQVFIAALRGEGRPQPVPPERLFRIQLDLGRTLLRAATWAGDDRMAREGLDAWEDALALLEAEPDLWLLEATLHAVLRLGWSHEDWPEAHGRALDALEGERVPIHRPLGEALQAWAQHDAQVAGERFLEVARAAEELAQGPEWEVLALTEAAHLLQRDDLALRARELAQHKGVLAFVPNPT